MQKTMLEKLKEDLRLEGVQPSWVGEVNDPWCDLDCPQHDSHGQCALLKGEPPSRHCSVAVAAMGKALQAPSLGEIVKLFPKCLDCGKSSTRMWQADLPQHKDQHFCDDHPASADELATLVDTPWADLVRGVTP
jgi:hypothetical protein